MEATGLGELEQIKQRAHDTWAAGDFGAVAERQIWAVGARVVDAASVTQGDDVLDVACGSGNAALRAAQAGARVVGLDLTPELFERGRTLAAEAGVSVEWVEGDAEALPYEDASYDVVLSTFGCMFAPRHAVAAREIARVLRPGGRMAITTWTPEGGIGSMFKTVASFVPPPPPQAEPPLLWGTPDHVDELFSGTGMKLSFAREVVEPVPFDTADEAVEFMSTKFGPTIMARRLTEANGRWDELRAALADLYERDEPMEYLLTQGTKEG